jgi:ribonuclease HII
MLSSFIKKNSIFSFGMATNLEIDNINILNATILSMKRALKYFKNHKNTIRVDGKKIFDFNNKVEFLEKGDEKSITIASASILAKCHRDRLLAKLSQFYPHYEWEKNKGYGTKKHYEAIKNFGITEIHRKSFLKKILDK